MTNHYNSDRVSPPGASVKNIIEERGLDKAQVAAQLGLQEKELDLFLMGDFEINYEFSKRLENVFEVPSDFWSRREERYRRWRATMQKIAV
jgi:HTH-type transcriptional regulator/antitoxin HigA